MNIYWHLPILIVVVSLVYSATRYDQWGAILRESLRWGIRLAAFLVGIGVVLYLVTVLTTFQMMICGGFLIAGIVAYSMVSAKA